MTSHTFSQISFVSFSKRKQKAVLSDYSYQHDLKMRLLLTDLTQNELALLNELLLYSLEVPLADLCHALSQSPETVIERLSKFASTKLFRVQGNSLILDKEKRRYFEKELVKFDPKFVPGMEYLQSLLQRVPPSLLPSWYALPRNCEKIFSSIIEKYFATPKIYQRYLQEIKLSDPVFKVIKEAVFASPELKISARRLQQKFSIGKEKFHEILLQLEYHFVCALSYELREDRWEEVVTPFHEWREYLLFHQQTRALSISDTSSIVRSHPRDFGFCEDLTSFLQTLKKQPIPLEVPHSTLVEKALLMHFVEIRDSFLIYRPYAEDWMRLEICEKALTMTRHPIQVEKGLKRVLHSGWIYVEDFLKGFTGVLRGKETHALTHQGKRWKYALPEYNEEEKALIRKTLLQRLFEAGIVATGSHLGKPCFCVTPFGISLFE